MKGNELKQKVLSNINKVIIGKEPVITLLLTALFAEGHVLLEDVPGTGKTKVAKALAKSMQMDFNRIQFTPDLLPADIVGISIFDQKQGDFVLKKGPAFTNILLADEINRATPRTQAGLLECMEEKQITIDGQSHPAGNPFFVIATQNPVETAGTFPLPEAQMDRFMMKLSMGLPSKEEEVKIMQTYLHEEPLTSLEAVVSTEDFVCALKEINAIFVHPCVMAYIADIISKTRNDESILMGVSPRGTLSFLRALKAYAYLEGRSFVTPDDVKMLAIPVLAHRMIMGYGKATANNAFLEGILKSIPAPTEDFSV